MLKVLLTAQHAWSATSYMQVQVCHWRSRAYLASGPVDVMAMWGVGSCSKLGGERVWMSGRVRLARAMCEELRRRGSYLAQAHRLA